MNKVILSGNLCKDIEVRYTPSNKPVIQNTIAVKNDFKNKDGNYDSQFINIVVWNNQAEYLANYAAKGSKVLVEGRLTNRSYDKQDGTKAYITEVVVEKLELLGAKTQENASKEETTSTAASNDLNLPKNYKTQYEEITISLTDEELPF